MPVTSHTVAVHLWAGPGFPFSVLCHQAAATAVRSPFPLLFARLNQPIALHLPSHALCSCSSHYGDSPLFSFLYVRVFPLLWAHTWGEHIRICLTRAVRLGMIPLMVQPGGVGVALLNGCPPASWPCCVPPGSPGLSCRAAPSWLAPACPTLRGFVHPSSPVLHWPLFNKSCKVPISQFLQPVLFE